MTICTHNVPEQQGSSPSSELVEALTRVLNEHWRSVPAAAGEILGVQTPDWSWAGAVGSRGDGRTVLTAAHRFRIASMSKPFVASAVLLLAEAGRLALDTAIGELLSSPAIEMLHHGGYDTDAITPAQLLRHTAGLYDYATDPAFINVIKTSPQHVWSRLDQLEHAIRHGKPYGPPGSIYGYSDTGYVLLGEIIERMTGRNLGASVRELIDFESLGLHTAHWELFEPAIETVPFTGSLLGDVDLSRAHPSFDAYGGGGLVATVGELMRFYRAMLQGTLFENPESRRFITAVPDVPAVDDDPGIARAPVPQLSFGQQPCWGHPGMWGQYAGYCPDIDLAFAWTMNQGENTRADFLRLTDKLARALGCG